MLPDKKDEEESVAVAVATMTATATKTTQPEQQQPAPPLSPNVASAAPEASEAPSEMPPADAKEHLRAISTKDGGQQQSAVERSISGTTKLNGSADSEQSATAHGDDNDGDDEDDDEVVVTLDDVLRQDAILTETADAVLGASSENDCSYPLGYIRQALYACLTCTPASDDESARAGICLACSYNCHEGHELIELYTKRHFRCDCGNAKFPSATPCKLVTDKAPRNDQNAYSQNFVGQYCSCHRPYPDPERVGDEVMLQCVVCEDWLHAEHVFPDEPPSGTDSGTESQRVPDDFDDFICVACMAKHPFLLAYDMDDDDDDGGEEQVEQNGQVDAPAPAPATCALERKLQAMAASDDAAQLTLVRPTFWVREWRDALCKCAACVARFEKAQIAFLLDPEDSLQAYEEAAAQARQVSGGSAEDLAQRAFASKLSHQQQVEMAIGYSHMKNSLQEYLAGFAAGGKTVRAEDIQSFFQDLREQKRQKTSHHE